MIALVTGGAKRIGACIVKTLHQANYDVIIHCQNSVAAANELAAQLNNQRQDSARVLQANLNNLSELHAMAESALAAWGPVDVLVNNASSFYATPVGEITETHWHDLMGSNLRAPLFLSQALAPALKNQRGCIVNIVDIHASKPLAKHPVYCAAKAGLAMLTQSLAQELGPEIRVNGVSPGAILWPGGDSTLDDTATQQGILDALPLKTMGSPEDIAAAVLFLVQKAPYVTGQILAVDGGRSTLI